ncbi:MAG: hypothetical protein GX094_02155 [Clostridiales bacterium]|jgi:hypothetical protein|nr:hypothetical protein [Clostridiales bacterium]
MGNEAGIFNAEEYITKLPMRRWNQKTSSWEIDYADYLEVKWRMVWFRNENRENTRTSIRDKIIDTKSRFAYYELEIVDSKGNVEIGVGSETGDDFEDYIEKAYTKAYGRALAALGYGTQFAPELEEGENVMDSPVESQKGKAEAVTSERPITEAQRRAIYAIYNALGYSEAQMREIIQNRYNKSESKSLTRREASDLIDYLNSIKNENITH